MKPLITTLALTTAVAAAPAWAGSDTTEGCSAQLSAASEAWAASKAERSEAEEVSVSTTEGSVDVTAQDAQPTENWFGKPPSDDTIQGYLAAAEEALEAGDEEACLAQVKNVEDALDAGTEKANAD